MAKPKALGGPRDIVRSMLNDEIIQIVLRDSSFGQSATFREQCYHAVRLLREERTPPVPFSLIGKYFGGLDGNTIREHWITFKQSGNNAGAVGRPSLLSDGQVTQLIDKIIECWRKKSPMNMAQIVNWAEGAFGLEICGNTMHHILRRDPRVRPVTGIPMEAERLAVDPQAIYDYFEKLMNEVSGAVAHFVFNMDEMGHQAWADAQETVCWVPVEEEAQSVYYPVSRQGKRITLIGCIAADGSFVRPAVIIARKTVDDEIFEQGLTPEKVEFYTQAKSYIETEIFEDWFKDTFVAEVVARRAKYEYRGPCFLLMDNCTCHTGALFEQLCEVHAIRPIWLPPHSSNQLQPLDLSIFGVTKRILGKVNRLGAENIQTYHISQVVNAFMGAAVPNNVVKSFRNAGICVIGDEKGIFCKISPERARCILGKLEIPPLPEVAEEEEDGDIEDWIDQCQELIFDVDVVQKTE